MSGDCDTLVRMLPPWTPDPQSLELLLSVSELGSVGKAAARHGMSQPSASERLRRMERRLGVTLLVRTTRGSSLTAAGEVVAGWSRDVIESLRGLTDGVQTLRADAVARLRVAASLTVAEYLLPAWLLRLRRSEPSVDIAVAVANSQEVCERVRAGQADLGFVESPSVPDGLSAAVVGRDRLVLVAAPGQRLPGRPSAEDLLTLPLLLREAGSGTRETFLAALGAAVREPVPDALHAAAELGSTTTILATAAAGGGVGVVSERAARPYVDAGSLVVLRSPVPLERELHAVWAGPQPGSAAAALITATAAG